MIGDKPKSAVGIQMVISLTDQAGQKPLSRSNRWVGHDIIETYFVKCRKKVTLDHFYVKVVI